MDYLRAAEYIRTGDLFLFRGRSLFSWLIRRYTYSVYSHAGVAIWVKADGEQRLCVLEAMEGSGVRLYPMDLYVKQCVKQGVIVCWYAIAADAGVNREKVAAFALKGWGTPYASLWSLLWLFGLLPRLFRFIFGLGVGYNDKGTFCSRYCAQALAYGGCVFGVGDPATPDLATPGDLVNLPCLVNRGVLTFAGDPCGSRG